MAVAMWDGWRDLPYADRQVERFEAINTQLLKGGWPRTPWLELERESLRRELEVLFPHREWR